MPGKRDDEARAVLAAERLAAVPVRGLAVGEKPYIILHALDRDAIVDLLYSFGGRAQTLKGATAPDTPLSQADGPEEYMTVTLSRDGTVTSHNAYEADFDEMVAATEKIVAALQERLANRKTCPFSHGAERRDPKTDQPRPTPAQPGEGVPEGMVPWAGGGSPPADWDGGAVLFRIGDMSMANPGPGMNWRHDPNGIAPLLDIIAYTPKPTTQPPQAGAGETLREAVARVIEPDEWALHDVGMAKSPPVPSMFIDRSLAKADAVLALAAAPPAPASPASVAMPSHPRESVRPAYSQVMVDVLDAFEQRVWVWAQGCEIDGIQQRSQRGDSYNEGHRDDVQKARSALIRQIDALTWEPPITSPDASVCGVEEGA